MKKRTSIVTAFVLSMSVILAFFIAAIFILWINQDITTGKTILSSVNRYRWMEIIAIFIAGILITSVVIRFIALNIKTNFRKFNRFFEDAAYHGKLINEDTLQYKEFVTLARSVNSMIEKENKTKKRIEFNEKYLQTILDAQTNIVLVKSKGKLKKANQAFYNFMKVRSLSEFHSLHSCISDFFIEDSSDEYLKKKYKNTSWVRHILKNPLKKHKVKISVEDKETIFEVNASVAELDDNYNIVITFHNINELEEQKRAFEKSATMDALTRVANRMKFDMILEQQIEMSKRYNHSFALILLDIDNFKMINDTYGHSVGDNILVELAMLMKNSVRKSDMVARWGGEEFAIILPQSRVKTAMKIAEKLRLKIENNSFEDGLNVTCSFGVCDYKKSYSVKTLIECVDEKLYEAKHSGKNQVRY
jgi:diguanylate cyclase (GGDEF)-like protein